MSNFAYVYAPRSGSNMGQFCYCNNPNCVCPTCEHTRVREWEGWTDSLDISSVSGGSLRFYGNSSIKSIRTEQVGWICQNTNLVPWTYGVVVSLYSNTAGTNYIGGVMYGHMEGGDRIANGHYNSGLWGRWLGRTPYADCDCGCYDGHHVHMQRRWGIDRNFNCWQTIYTGSTWLYRFNTPL